MVPDVGLLLEIDRKFREKAAAGALHARVGPQRFTALYSSAQDWVVIYFDDELHDDGQVTVVTERRGTLAGKRVVRGLEAECAAHYRQEERPCSGSSAPLPIAG